MTGGAAGRVVIVGAGPTGLGAGYRLAELGYDDWVILEGADTVGGLATSVTDEQGFVWDIGGHVLFSHYPYYDAMVDRVMGQACSTLDRQAWIWMENRFIPYPFQNNIRDLSPQTVLDCLLGAVQAAGAVDVRPANFAEWIHATMGAGIARHFMVPYNTKVWATPPELMDYQWIGERVATVDVQALVRGVLFGQVGPAWGPNATFRYPLRGGTGFLYQGLRRFVEPHLRLGVRVVRVDQERKVVFTDDGREWRYDVLLSTVPLDDLVREMLVDPPEPVRQAAGMLAHSGSHIVGIGVDRAGDSDKNWVYFPESDVPFYRVTYLSNYSPYLSARPGQLMLLTETSTSSHRPEEAATIVDRVIDGLVRTGLLDADDRALIATRWHLPVAKSYPVPSLERDAALGRIQPWLRQRSIWSRGRFGAWLYEIGNMDHSAMQGVEFVNAALFGAAETVWIPRGEGPAGEGIR